MTKTQKEIQKAATEFAKGEFEAEQARELEKGGEFPGRLWEKAGELGFIGVHFPEAYGGGGLGLLEQVLVSEAFCVQDPSLGPALSLGALGAECFLHAGAPRCLRESGGQEEIPARVREWWVDHGRGHD